MLFIDTRLKPCPFCGNKIGNRVCNIPTEQTKHGQIHGCFVECDACQAQGPWFPSAPECEPEAIKRWNEASE